MSDKSETPQATLLEWLIFFGIVFAFISLGFAIGANTIHFHSDKELLDEIVKRQIHTLDKNDNDKKYLKDKNRALSELILKLEKSKEGDRK